MTAILRLSPAILLLGLFFAPACSGDATSSVTASPHGSVTSDVSKLPLAEPYELYVAATDGSGDHRVYSSERYLGSYVWSPDGSQFAVTDTVGTTATTVRILSLDGVERASFVRKGYPNRLTWSPDGRLVVADFSENNSTDSIITVDPINGEQKELLRAPNNTYSHLLGGWLPGGELRLIQTAKATANGKLFALNVETGASRQLSDITVVPNYYSDATISPDRKQLAVFAAASRGGCPGSDYASAVFTIDIATGAAGQVTQEVYCSPGDLVWSPDGKQIAYLRFSMSDGTATLNSVDLASHQVRPLTAGLNEPVAWLADGTILANKQACTGCDGGGPPRVVAINSQTGESHELTGSVPSAVSVSGRIVAADGAIKEINGQGGLVSTLAKIESNWQYGSMTWSPDGRHVAYSRSLAMGRHIFQINRDGSGFERIASYDGSTEPSPDGLRIAFLKHDQSDNGKSIGRLWLAGAAGSNAKQVSLDGSVGAYSWSPDSTRLMFTNVDLATGNAVEYLVNADGSDVRPVGTGNVVGEAKGGVPAWSPNGKLAVFFGDPIDVIDVDTGEQRNFPGGGPKGTAAWSPDSTKIIYSSFVNVPPSPLGTDQIHSNLYILDVESGATTQVPGDNTQKGGFAMSPDGQTIAYVTSPLGSATAQLRVTTVDGSVDSLVLDGASSTLAPAWSPDGDWLAVASASDPTTTGIFAVRRDGLEAHQLTRGGRPDRISWLDNDRLSFSIYIGGL